jgi:DNA-binding IclR family transcriptional regulator
MAIRNTRSAGASRPGIQVIARAAAILRALEEDPNGLSLSQIAERVKLARSTVQRIVSALAAEHLLIAATPTAGIKLGPALIRLASFANVSIDKLIRPTLLNLSRTLKETVDLSQLKGDRAVFIEQIPGEHRLRAVSAVGESFPLHCTANGKALLSLLPEDRWGKLVGKPLRAYTPQTITDMGKLRSEIENFRRTQIAIDREEHTEGIAAVGTAFLDPRGLPLAISIPVPTTRFGRLEQKIVAELRRTRREIEQLVKA